MIGLGLLVVFLGGMVIYSIYYVSVISNIQEMGVITEYPLTLECEVVEI